MATVDTPHFAFPFSFGTMGVADVDQQGSIEEIEACVGRVVTSFLGDLPDVPDFGIPSPLFANAPIDTSAIQRAIVLWEPRASKTVVVESAGVDDPSHRVITVEVS